MKRTPLLWGTLALVAVTLNVLIVRKEAILRDGRTLLLPLASRDPRSLMQGDYMTLRYRLADQLPPGPIPAKGVLIVRVDTNGVATGGVRLGGDDPPGADELRLGYRNRGALRLGAESYLFQEGQQDLFAQAAYGELRVAPNGESILVGLRDRNLQRLGPDRR